MEIHYFLIKVLPDLNSDNFKEYGGAYFNCWVRRDSFKEAEETALETIRANGWNPVKIEDYNLPVREQYADEPESLEVFDQAIEYGEGYIADTWPIEPQEDDTIN